MINQSKPDVSTPQTELNIGSGFNLLVGGLFKLIIGPLATIGLTNAAKGDLGETWDTISTSWDTETKSWLAISKLITNINASNSGFIWSAKNAPWINATVWVGNSITNLDKP